MLITNELANSAPVRIQTEPLFERLCGGLALFGSALPGVTRCILLLNLLFIRRLWPYYTRIPLMFSDAGIPSSN